ncbi:MAG: hypothetical protein ACAI38_21810 [Myxococcota bacterium]|nr:hypothetical protein [Myxococcota bacterium]
MAINRIDQLQRTTALPTAEDSQAGRSARLELNQQSSFERGSDSDFDPANFQSSFTDDQRREAQARFESLPIEDQEAVDTAVTKVYLGLSGVRTGTTTTAEVGASLAEGLSTYSNALYGVRGLPAANRVSRGSGGSGEVTDIMVRVMGRVEDTVAQFAIDLQGKINMKSELRTQLAEVRDMVANWPEGAETQTFTYTSYDVDSSTGKVTETVHTEELTKEQAMALQERMQSQLDTLSDITQMQQFELQQKYQQQQEAMQTLSEILRSMHDTMKNTIANVKAS